MTAEAKQLTMEIEIKRIKSDHVPSLEYSLNGWVQEKGECFGFGCPLTKEEATNEKIDELIKRECEPSKWGLSEESIKIIPKIISDCRQQQKTLFDNYALQEENPKECEGEASKEKNLALATSR